MRSVIAAVLFATVAALVAVSQPGEIAAQDKKDEKKTQPKFDPPKLQKPDEATLKIIAEKTGQLSLEVLKLKVRRLRGDITDNDLADVEIYWKAAENIVRFDEWYNANSGKWTIQALDEGLARAKEVNVGKAPWRDVAGKWVVRGYISRVDGSAQPYAVLLPPDFYKDPKKTWRLDVVLHGRDGSLTEAKFIASHQGNAPKDLGYVQLEVYGRGNNAYRWAGETDVFEAIDAATRATAEVDERKTLHDRINRDRIVLRGFSMGGAGTWHLGLHRPDRFCVIGPGAGFTTTHGYVGNLPRELPDYQEKCLRIYDAVDYAENAFNVPIVAYSGEKDAQKKAADNIENALKNFKEPHKFTHLIAPGLEHQMPKEWQEKAEAEYRKYADKGREREPNRIRFVTYTSQYGMCDWVWIQSLEKQYEKATVDAVREGDRFAIKTTNVRELLFAIRDPKPKATYAVMIDGQEFKNAKPSDPVLPHLRFKQSDGRWINTNRSFLDPPPNPPVKERSLTGPIDDAFTERFDVVRPLDEGWHAVPNKHIDANTEQFAKVWDRYFRGKLPTIKTNDYDPKKHYGSLVLFGDPQSNPLIAKVLPKLPITWTKEKLVVNGVEYDPKTHLPVLIYPNPLNPGKYVVINSGHTFKEADLKGTNALLYPRLGDWAVIKPTPTEKDPAAYEVVAAGLFDENWQFPKKK